MPSKEKYTKYSKELWEILFNEYYHDEIIDLARVFPKQQSLVVSYDWLTNCWGARVDPPTEAVDYLVREPEEVLRGANEALHGFTLPIPAPEGWQKARVEISGFKPEIAIRDIKHEYFDKLVSVTGTVAQATAVRPKIVNAAYRCMRCGHITMVMQGDEKLLKPLECESDTCGRKGFFELLLRESEFEDYQEIILQDSTNAKIKVVLLDNLVTLFYPLQELTITGIVRARIKLKGKAKTSFLEMYIKANHIEVSKNDGVLGSHAR